MAAINVVTVLDPNVTIRKQFWTGYKKYAAVHIGDVSITSYDVQQLRDIAQAFNDAATELAQNANDD